MKVGLLNYSQKNYFSSQTANDYSYLSGQSAVRNYLESEKNLNKTGEDKYTETQKIIYASLESMAAYGKYNAFKTLFKQIEQEEELKEDPYLYNNAGNVYKAEHDITKAHELYQNAYQHADEENTDRDTFFTIEKNYLESCYQLDENINNELIVLKNRNIPESTVNYLELNSFVDLKNGNKDKAKEGILAAYHIAKNNNIIRDDLYFKAAVVMSHDSRFDDSTQICKTRLDRLKKENKTFTHEFLNYLTLLGVNNYYMSKDDNRAEDTLLNALELEKTIKDPVVKETLDYYLLKIRFEKPDTSLFKVSNDFINNSENRFHQKDICEKAASYAVKLLEDGTYSKKDSKDIAMLYFNKLEDMLIQENSDEDLKNLYIKLQGLYPELYDVYMEKINKLNDNYDLPLKQMLNDINYNLRTNNEEKLQKNLNAIIDDKSIDRTRKCIAKNYILLLRINKGIDFEKSTEELTRNLDELYEIYSNDTSNKILAEHIYDVYNRLANIQHRASEFYKSAELTDKAFKLASKLALPENELKKLKVYSTLRYYKAKRYYSAELDCLDFLQMISGVSKDNARYTSVYNYINNKDENQCKKIAATLETLGIINLKNRNYNDAIEYYQKAVEIRNKLSSKDIYLANDYAALARLAILGYKIFGDNLSSKEMHNKCLKILDMKYPDENVTREEHNFHEKYYGRTMASAGKFISFHRDTSAIIDKFKCYNRELNICE